MEVRYALRPKGSDKMTLVRVSDEGVLEERVEVVCDDLDPEEAKALVRAMEESEATITGGRG